MKIKYSKDYSKTPDLRWSQVVSDFLTYLSGVYGYKIDEYDLLILHNDMKINQLAPLVNGGNKMATELFAHFVRRDMELKVKANQLRAEDRAALKVLAGE